MLTVPDVPAWIPLYDEYKTTYCCHPILPCFTRALSPDGRNIVWMVAGMARFHYRTNMN